MTAVIGLNINRRGPSWAKVYPSLDGCKLEGTWHDIIRTVFAMSKRLDNAPVAMWRCGTDELIAHELRKRGVRVVEIGLKHGNHEELLALGIAAAAACDLSKQQIDNLSKPKHVESCASIIEDTGGIA